LSAIQARKPASHPAKHQLGRLEDKLKVKTSKPIYCLNWSAAWINWLLASLSKSVLSSKRIWRTNLTRPV